MSKRRSRMDIIHSILKTIREDSVGAYKTRILYRSNLSHPVLKRYLDLITGNELVKTDRIGEKSVYCITDKGREFIKTYEKMRSTLV